MPLESPPSSTHSVVRTIDDIRRERGENYPQKHRDTIRNKKDRSDFLAVGYDMIISPPRKKEIFSRLLLAGSFSNRKMMVDLIKWKDKQLGLMGIFKKIISFDYGIDVLALTDDELLKILREMQVLFEPETIQKVTRPAPQTAPANSSPVPEKNNSRLFMGREITNTFILAVLDALPVQAPPEPEPIPETKIVAPSPIPTSVSSVVQPVATKINHTLQLTRRPVLPPEPRRWYRDQHVGRRAWVVPARVREELRTKNEPKTETVAPTPAPEVLYTGPTFMSLDEAVVWLREQAQWEKFYPQAVSLQDDLALMSFLRSNIPQLLPILLAIKQKFGCKTQKEILQAVISPPVKPEPEPKPTSPHVPAVSLETAELHLSAEHEKQIKGIFALHQSGKYREFWSAFQELAGTDVFEEIKEVRTMFGHPSYLHAIAYIAGVELVEKDLKPYRKHQWYDRIRDLPYVSTQLQRLLDRGNDAKRMHIIEAILGDTKIKVPAQDVKKPETIKEEWLGFDEIDAPERTLLDIVIALVKARSAYQKKDEESTKKLLRIVKIIMWIEQVTTQDVAVKESE